MTTSQLILGDLDITPLLDAHKTLTLFMKTMNTDQEKAGVIQAFEFCYELAWKTMKRILAKRGVNVNSPRETFRASALEKLIADPVVWFGFIELRNSTVHTYNRSIVVTIIAELPDFKNALDQFIATIQKLK